MSENLRSLRLSVDDLGGVEVGRKVLDDLILHGVTAHVDTPNVVEVVLARARHESRLAARDQVLVDHDAVAPDRRFPVLEADDKLEHVRLVRDRRQDVEALHTHNDSAVRGTNTPHTPHTTHHTTHHTPHTTHHTPHTTHHTPHTTHHTHHTPHTTHHTPHTTHHTQHTTHHTPHTTTPHTT